MRDSKVVVFKIDDEEFASDIMQVERILSYVEPNKIPDSPSYIKGVINYEDSILPIMDVKKRFNLNATKIKDDPKIIVVKYGERKIGLIVDMVSEVINIDEKILENAPDMVKGIKNTYLKGMIKLDDRIIILIDTEKILSKDDFEQLEIHAN